LTLERGELSIESARELQVSIDVLDLGHGESGVERRIESAIVLEDADHGIGPFV